VGENANRVGVSVVKTNVKAPLGGLLLMLQRGKVVLGLAARPRSWGRRRIHCEDLTIQIHRGGVKATRSNSQASRGECRCL